MPTFFDWLRYQKKISENQYYDLSKEKKVSLKQEWCGRLGSKKTANQ